MNTKELILYAMTKERPALKKTRSQWIDLLASNYELEREVSHSMIIECTREGLISIDNAKFLTVEQPGLDWLKKQQNAHINGNVSEISSLVVEQNVVKNWKTKLKRGLKLVWSFVNLNLVAALIAGLVLYWILHSK